MEVPEHRFFARFELLQQSNDLIEAGDGSALKAETLCDARKWPNIDPLSSSLSARSL
jgi:hypothetical protein